LLDGRQRSYSWQVGRMGGVGRVEISALRQRRESTGVQHIIFAPTNPLI
jgi:hypothetical protein